MMCSTMPERIITPSAPDSVIYHEQYGEKMVSFQPDDGYQIKLSVFEGPIDLLLYLIKKKELDIHEISLSEIAREYLEYVELIKLIDLEKAGDFIVVAATLMKLKSRSLFVFPDSEKSDLEEDDPRNTLIRYLMEYEKLSGAAEKLAEKEDSRRNIFPRGGEKNRIARFIAERETTPDYVLFELLTALRDVLKDVPHVSTHEIKLLNVTPEMKQREIMEAIELHGEVDFIIMVTGQPRLIIVVTFIAMLELIKSRKICVRQSKQFSRILLYRRLEDESQDN